MAEQFGETRPPPGQYGASAPRISLAAYVIAVHGWRTPPRLTHPMGPARVH